MKLFVVSLFVLTLIGVTNEAMAADNSEISITNNSKEKSGVEEGKKSGKYTFTLFSFFNTEENNAKSDSVRTNSTITEPKGKTKVNSVL